MCPTLRADHPAPLVFLLLILRRYLSPIGEEFPEFYAQGCRKLFKRRPRWTPQTCIESLNSDTKRSGEALHRVAPFLYNFLYSVIHIYNNV